MKICSFFICFEKKKPRTIRTLRPRAYGEHQNARCRRCEALSVHSSVLSMRTELDSGGDKGYNTHKETFMKLKLQNG